MHFRLSKFGRAVIIINIVLSIIMIGFNSYNVHRLKESNAMIQAVAEEHQVARDTAIRWLKRDGVDLFIDQEFPTFSGIFLSVMTLFLIYVYSRSNGFYVGFFAAFCALFSSFIGGALLFYALFSGRTENHHVETEYTPTSEWEKYFDSQNNKSNHLEIEIQRAPNAPTSVSPR